MIKIKVANDKDYTYTYYYKSENIFRLNFVRKRAVALLCFLK